MHNLPFDFTEADRTALVDEVTKLIARVPRLVGTEVNWIEQAAQAVLKAFEEQTMLGLDRLRQVEIEEHILKFATSPSIFGAAQAAESVFSKLQDFFEERNQPSWMKDPSIPTDETHDFGIVAKELIENGSEIDMLQFGPSVVLTEAQALKALAGLKDLDSDLEFVLIARPKPPRWKVLDYKD